MRAEKTLLAWTKRLARRLTNPARVSPAGTALLERCAEIYPHLGAAIVAALPAGWCKSWARAEMDERQGAITLYFTDAGGSVRSTAPPLALYDRFRELNGAARAASAAWTSATVALDASGKLDVDYGYDPIPIETQNERDEAWAVRYLPGR